MFITGDAGFAAGGSPNLMGSAGREVLPNGAQSFNVVFFAPKATVLFEVFCTFYNTVDAQPIFLQYIVTSQSLLGFTVIFNAPTDSANYELGWVAVDDV